MLPTTAKPQNEKDHTLSKAILMILKERRGKPHWEALSHHQGLLVVKSQPQGTRASCLGIAREGDMWEQLYATCEPWASDNALLQTRRAILAACLLLWQPLSRLTPAAGLGFSVSKLSPRHPLSPTKGTPLSLCTHTEKSSPGPGFPQKPHSSPSSFTTMCCANAPQEKTLAAFIDISRAYVKAARAYIRKSIDCYAT